jgi:hypothetical protein
MTGAQGLVMGHAAGLGSRHDLAWAVKIAALGGVRVALLKPEPKMTFAAVCGSA